MDVSTGENIITAAGAAVLRYHKNCDSSKIAAEYKNGELKISIPKMEAKEPKKAKSISIN